MASANTITIVQRVPDPIIVQTIEQDQTFKGEGWNCYLYVSNRRTIPRMAQIQPNSEAKVGAVAIFYYHDKKTGEIVKHIALVSRVNDDSVEIKETNFKAGKYTTRVIPFSDSYLSGFWDSNPL